MNDRARKRAALKRRLARAGALRLAKRLLKPIPVVGTAMTVGLAGHEIRKKGALSWGGARRPQPVAGRRHGEGRRRGDLAPGDLIPNKKPRRVPESLRRGGKDKTDK